MFSDQDLIVNSIWPALLILLTIAVAIGESFISDKKFISPWISMAMCAICLVVLIALQGTLADVLIYLVSVLVARLIIVMVKGGKKNDV